MALYAITYVTEMMVDETWHNDIIDVASLRPSDVASQFNVDVRSYRVVQRGSNGRDYYYPLYLDGERWRDPERGLMYLRITTPVEART